MLIRFKWIISPSGREASRTQSVWFPLFSSLITSRIIWSVNSRTSLWILWENDLTENRRKGTTLLVLIVFVFLFKLDFSGTMKKQEVVAQSDEPLTVTVRSMEHFRVFQLVLLVFTGRNVAGLIPSHFSESSNKPAVHLPRTKQWTNTSTFFFKMQLSPLRIGEWLVSHKQQQTSFLFLFEE